MSFTRRIRLSSLALSSLALALTGSTSHAQVRTFDAGGDGTSYLDAVNWSDDDVPNTLGETAVIDAGGAFDVVLGGSVNIGGGTIGSDDSLSVNGGVNFTITGATFTNDGVVTINAAGSLANTTFDPNAMLSLTGTGDLVLNAPTDSALQHAQVGAAINDFAITQDVDHTIRGAGRITTSLLNNGTVNADVNGRTLQLLGGSISDGLLTASSGGILLITSNINQTGGGTIDSATGTVNIQSGLIEAGTLAGGDINVIGNSAIGDNLITADIDVLGGVSFGINSIITNNGSITVNQAASLANTTLDPNIPTTFDGTGEIVLNASGDAALQHAQIGAAVNDHAITQGADHTVSGTGQIVTAFNNNGTINANVSGRTLRLLGGTKTNNGLLTASNDGILQLTTIIQNATGVIDSSSGVVQLAGATINGGELTGSDFTVTGSSTLTDIETDAAIETAGGLSLAVNGSITNNGSIILNEPGALANTTLDPNTPTTFDGTGEIVLNASGDAALQHAQIGAAVNDHAITQGADHTVSGTGQIVTAFNNNGTINANVSGRTLRLLGGTKTNNGLLTASNDGILQLNTIIQNVTGVIDSSSGVVQLAGATINGGELTGGDFTVTGSSTLTDVETDAAIETAGGLSLAVNGSITNNGSIILNEPGAVANTTLDPSTPTTFEGTGEIVLNASGDAALQHAQIGAAVNDHAITQGADHTVSGTGQIVTAFNNNGIINANVSGRTLRLLGGTKTNNGTIRASNGGILDIDYTSYTNDGVLDAQAGSLIQAGSTLNNSDTSAMTGSGEIKAAMVTTAGLIQPGDGIGELTVDGDLDLMSTASLEIEIGTMQADLLTVTGDLLLGGDLMVIMQGDIPTPGEVIAVADGETLDGLFANVANGDTLLSADGRATFVVNYGMSSVYDPTQVVLSDFTDNTIPEPTSIVLAAVAAMGLVYSRRRG